IAGSYVTIQQGVNACETGGTVSVSAGTYTEAVYINKQIALVGVGTPTITASELEEETNTVTFDGTLTDNASISGFKITGATGNIPNGNGIYCKNGASPIITNNTITGNSNGIYCDSSSPTITNNTITGNSNGIYCNSSTSPSITNNTISGNGEGILCHSSSPSITNNTISGNTGIGIYCYSSSPTITNNTISGNNYGIYCDSSSPTITNNTISGNNYGILCNSSSPSITNNTISGNNCGIYCISSSPAITNNTISGNTWHGINCSSSSPSITNNTISGNNYGIYCFSSSSPAITNNIISGNNNYGIYENDSSSDPPTNYNCFFNNTPADYFNENSKSKDVAWLNTQWTGNISADPQFIAGADFHLQSTSPCIDSGLNTAPGIYGTSTDKDGHPRIVRTVDMGAYEFQMDFVAIRTLRPTQGLIGQIVTIGGITSATNSVVNIDFGTHLTITTTLLSQNGTFSAIFIVSTQPGGTTIITVISHSLLVTGSFFILAQITLDSPISGVVGQEVTIEGLGTRELVRIDFGTHQGITTTTSSPNGTFSLTFIIDTQPGGTTVITVISHSSLVTGSFFILPQITLFSPFSGPVNIVITLQGSGVWDKGLVRIDFGTHQSITTLLAGIDGRFSVTFMVSSQQIGTKVLTVTDLFLNQKITALFELTSDTDPPIAGIEDLFSIYTRTNGTVTVVFTYEEPYPASYQVVIGSGAITIGSATGCLFGGERGSCTINIGTGEDGSYTINLYIKDTSGNIGSATTFIILDNTPPAVSLTSPITTVY
ncbi:right-handed parallel beta-helix repeat-containing protein, partial [Patescibacteria group bacterium]|nr:right-handed parallel beta-helix repeat-containing protein [Patescibacteria group bacterium]